MLRATVAIFLSVLFLSPVIAHGQQDQQGADFSGDRQEGSWRFGYTGFRMLLEERGLQVQQNLEQAMRFPQASVVVLLGDLSRMSVPEWRRLRIFVDRGGSLLVASESSFPLPGVTRFRAGPVVSRMPSDRYQGFPDCIGVADLNADHPLTKGIREVIVNRTGWLSESEDDSLDWQVVARLPDDCTPTAARGKPVLLVGMDPRPDRGVMILAADQSLFSDGMLWHGDNSLLSIQAIDLLCRGTRSSLTVLDNGTSLPGYMQTLDQRPGIPPVPAPQMPPETPETPEPELARFLREANTGIDAIQQSNLLNDTLRDRPRNLRPVAWLRTVLLVLVILLTILLLWKLVQKRSLAVPPSHARFMQSMYGVNSAKQMETSDFASAVEVLSRDLCREISASQDPAEWQKLLSGGKGSLISRLSRRQRKSFVAIVQHATRGFRDHYSNKQFQAFGRSIQELRQIHRTSLPRPAFQPA